MAKKTSRMERYMQLYGWYQRLSRAADIRLVRVLLAGGDDSDLKYLGKCAALRARISEKMAYIIAVA